MMLPLELRKCTTSSSAYGVTAMALALVCVCVCVCERGAKRIRKWAENQDRPAYIWKVIIWKVMDAIAREHKTILQNRTFRKR